MINDARKELLGCSTICMLGVWINNGLPKYVYNFAVFKSDPAVTDLKIVLNKIISILSWHLHGCRELHYSGTNIDSLQHTTSAMLQKNSIQP